MPLVKQYGILAVLLISIKVKVAIFLVLRLALECVKIKPTINKRRPVEKNNDSNQSHHSLL
jgi:hypothetical protein